MGWICTSVAKDQVYELKELAIRELDTTLVYLINFALKADVGRFFTYPYNVLKEVLVNTVLYRIWHMGSDIKMSMFDDRLEILSTKRLPFVVMVDNIRDTCFRKSHVLPDCLQNLAD